MPIRRSDRTARLRRLAAVAAVVAALGCGGSAPPTRAAPPRAPDETVVHVVKRGETLWRISKRYGVSLEEVVRANGITDVTEVPVGTRLRIPRPGQRLEPRPATAGRPKALDPEVADRAVRDLGLRFGWPLRGTLNSRFGGRRWGEHDGIDIGARKGTPIRASEAGRVIYSGTLGDYGRVVIVKHVGDWSSVYAHNRRNRVSEGRFVEKGDVIAEVGQSGNASGPHLHFELRKGQTPVDPLRYLP